jgi:hypothetical protein
LCRQPHSRGLFVPPHTCGLGVSTRHLKMSRLLLAPLRAPSHCARSPTAQSQNHASLAEMVAGAWAPQQRPRLEMCPWRCWAGRAQASHAHPCTPCALWVLPLPLPSIPMATGGRTHWAGSAPTGSAPAVWKSRLRLHPCQFLGVIQSLFPCPCLDPCLCPPPAVSASHLCLSLSLSHVFLVSRSRTRSQTLTLPPPYPTPTPYYSGSFPGLVPP